MGATSTTKCSLNSLSSCSEVILDGVGEAWTSVRPHQSLLTRGGTHADGLRSTAGVCRAGGMGPEARVCRASGEL